MLKPQYHYFKFWYCMRDWAKVLHKNDLLIRVSRESLKGSDFLTPKDWGEYLSDEQKRNLMFTFMNGGQHMLLEHWCDDDFKESPEEMAELVWYIATGQAYMNIKEKGKK